MQKIELQYSLNALIQKVIERTDEQKLDKKQRLHLELTNKTHSLM
jgi:hypothetical protein